MFPVIVGLTLHNKAIRLILIFSLSSKRRNLQTEGKLTKQLKDAKHTTRKHESMATAI